MLPLGPTAATLLVVQCAISAAHEAPAEARPLKIVAFGTSLTARGGWTTPLQTALSRCLKRPVEVAAIAMSGATSDWGVKTASRVISAAPDIVLIEFYANDAALHRFVSLGRSRQNLQRIIDELRARLPEARILTMAMNPITGMRGLIRPLLDCYIEAHREVARDKGIDFVDLRPAWRQLSAAELAAAIPDGAHPLPEAAAAVIVPALMMRIAPGSCQELSAGAQLQTGHGIQ